MKPRQMAQLITEDIHSGELGILNEGTFTYKIHTKGNPAPPSPANVAIELTDVDEFGSDDRPNRYYPPNVILAVDIHPIKDRNLLYIATGSGRNRHRLGSRGTPYKSCPWAHYDNDEFHDALAAFMAAHPTPPDNKRLGGHSYDREAFMAEFGHILGAFVIWDKWPVITMRLDRVAKIEKIGGEHVKI